MIVITPDSTISLSPYGIEDDSGGGMWAKALCAQTDPEAFYPEQGESPTEAKRVCFRCDIRDECLEYALETDQKHGVWGAKTRSERVKIKKARQQEREASDAVV